MLLHLLTDAGRVALIYVALFLMLRLAGRREIAQLTPMDLLTMLLLSETVSPALGDSKQPIAGGLVAASVLILCTVALGRLGGRGKRFDRWLEGHAEIIVSDGRVIEEKLRHFRVTDQQLRTALHEAGLLEVAQVKRAFVEPNGQITVIKAED